MTVLLVDDSHMIRRLLSAALSESGATEILEADSADKALRMLKFCGEVNLILTDWHMPGTSGLDFVKQLRADPRFADTPIIMSTSESAGENVVAALKAGVTNYIIKPFDKKQLNEKVGPYLRQRRAEAAVSSSLSPAVAHSGTLKGGDLADVLQFFIQARRTGYCELVPVHQAPAALLFFRSGKLIGATYQSAAGEEAFFACFASSFQKYAFHEREYHCPPGTAVTMSTPALLIEALARTDSKKRGS